MPVTQGAVQHRGADQQGRDAARPVEHPQQVRQGLHETASSAPAAQANYDGHPRTAANGVPARATKPPWRGAGNESAGRRLGNRKIALRIVR
jgi:hypothetical protein